jgi:hypothetical protein
VHQSLSHLGFPLPCRGSQPDAVQQEKEAPAREHRMYGIECPLFPFVAAVVH